MNSHNPFLYLYIYFLIIVYHPNTVLSHSGPYRKDICNLATAALGCCEPHQLPESPELSKPFATATPETPRPV